MKTEPQPAETDLETETETEPAEVEIASGDTDAPVTLLELVLAEHAARADSAAAEPPAAPDPEPARIEGVVIGRVVALGAAGEPLVDYPGNPRADALPARAMAAIAAADVGREAALLFEGGDRLRPVIMGLMHAPAGAPEKAAPAAPRAAEIDGESLVFNAEKEIVLRCGKASITLTRAGKILIRGAYLVARSSGVNRIQGGSVQIN